MSILSRALLIFRMKGTAMLNMAEDPRQVLTYADEQQHELLRKVKQGLIEVAISKRQLQKQVETLDTKIPLFEGQARRALSAGREDLARLALKRKQTAMAEIGTLEVQVNDVGEDENKLVLAEQQLAARIDEFRMHRQAITARYTAAEAQVKVNEALSGVSQDFTDLGMALGRADEKIDRMLAHASAIDALVDSGVLTLPTVEGDIVERELREVAEQDAVDEELTAMQKEMASDKAPEGDDQWKPYAEQP